MKTKTKNAISAWIFGATLCLWGLLIIYSFLCAPSAPNAYGYYTDTVDNMIGESIYQNHGQLVAILYLPLDFLIEPTSEGHSAWYILTAFILIAVGLRLFYLMVKGIPEDDAEESVRTSSVVTCVVLLCYIVSYVVLAIV